ncbi:MAG: hypothetical protein ACD_4C00134G0003, partial [uncultured bacterium (gcode 4)]
MNMNEFSNDLIRHWKSDLLEVIKQEQIYIVSGESNHCLFVNIKDELVEAVKISGLPILMIAGPVISIEEKTKSNPVFDLINNGYIELYVSPFRQLSHYRIIGNRKMYLEEYHEALSLERKGHYIYDRFIILISTLIRRHM